MVKHEIILPIIHEEEKQPEISIQPYLLFLILSCLTFPLLMILLTLLFSALLVEK